MTAAIHGSAPMVSIVIPVFNGADFLDEAIESALAQTWSNTEIIVVDDGSTDDGATRRIIERYGSHIRAIHQENGGVSRAVNTGVAAMRGDCFSWLSHDDRHHPDKTAIQVDALRALDAPGMVYSDVLLIDSEGAAVESPSRGTPPDSRSSHGLWAVLEGWINGCAIMLSRECLEVCGPFNPFLPTTQDYEMWFRVARRFPILHVAGPLATHRLHPGQGSRTQRHLEEAGLLWLSFLDRLDPSEMRALSGSPERFAERMQGFFAAAPYRSARFAGERLRRRHLKTSLLGRLRRALRPDHRRTRSTDDVMAEIGLGPAPPVDDVTAERADLQGCLHAGPATSGIRDAGGTDMDGTVVFILHGLGGGTARYGSELATLLRARTRVCFLRRTQDGIELDVDDRFPEPLRFRPDRPEDVCEALGRFGVLRVGVLHALGWNGTLVDLLDRLGRPFDLFLSDYHIVSDRPHLASDRPAFIGDAGIRDLIADEDPVRSYLLGRADRLFACSHDLARRLARMGLTRPVTVAVPPGTAAARNYQCRMPPLRGGEPLRVLVIGDLPGTKGRDVVLEVAALASRQRCAVEFHLFGRAHPPLSSREGRLMTVHGAGGASLADTVCWLDPHVVLLPFQLPETHSYVLTDAMMMGLPVLASDIGAVSGRLRGRPLSWTLQWDAPAGSWLEALLRIRDRVVANDMPDMGPAHRAPEMDARTYFAYGGDGHAG